MDWQQRLIGALLLPFLSKCKEGSCGNARQIKRTMNAM
jgi:hypothetical protein